MKLKISHTTHYTYDGPAHYTLQRLRLSPPTAPGQKVLNWSVTVEGADPQVVYDDQFGNRTELLSISGDHHTVSVVAAGEVETEDRNGVFGEHLGHCPLWLFLRETPLTKPGKHIRELARGIADDNPLARLHALMGAVHEAVAYEPGASGTETTAEAALDAKAGVCQDHTHIFLAAARLLGVPARYVSGYLLMDDRTQQTASHAWAEAHVAGLGWVGFDVANKICPDSRYVRVATGLDYVDAAPISGLRLGEADETMTVSLSVEAAMSQSQSQS
ncbi:transglutaminase family protein [Rhizobium sp. YJ-22]|uniref:transglutaminase family protein n=1 Tax=Rhizobium sp. YJ-22 TaxID=3037556 RepID=UPI00241244F3|nr:transglutaminase family protein [Rhizobium sp. YJ-22]MDG3576203.1 transglutaminase family protein [Rhizobium sp. YJ-22]